MVWEFVFKVFISLDDNRQVIINYHNDNKCCFMQRIINMNLDQANVTVKYFETYFKSLQKVAKTVMMRLAANKFKEAFDDSS